MISKNSSTTSTSKLQVDALNRRRSPFTQPSARCHWWLDLCIWLPTCWAGGSTLWPAAIMRAAAIYRLVCTSPSANRQHPISAWHSLGWGWLGLRGLITQPLGLASAFWLQVGLLYLTAQLAQTWRAGALLRWWLGAHMVAIVHCLLALLRFGLDGDRGAGGFVHANDAAAFLLPLWIHALSYWHAPHRRWRQLARGQAILLSVAIATSLSRGAILTAFLAAFVLPLRQRKQHSKARMALLLLCLLIGAAVWYHRQRDVSDVTRFARLAIWSASAQVAWHHPWGVGFGRYAASMRQQGIWSNPTIRYGLEAHHAHNEWLMLVVEGGWLMIPLMLGLAWQAKAIYRRLGRRQQGLALAYGCAFLVPATVSANLRLPCVALLAGLTWAHFARQAQEHSTQAATKLLALISNALTPATAKLPYPRIALLSAYCLLLLAAPISATMGQIAQYAHQQHYLELAVRLAQASALVAPWRLQSQMLCLRLQPQQERQQQHALQMPQQLPPALQHITQRFRDAPEPWLFAAASLLSEAGGSKPTPQQATALAMSQWLLEACKRAPYRLQPWLQLARIQRKAGLLDQARQTLLYVRWLEPYAASPMVELAALEQAYPLWSSQSGYPTLLVHEQLADSQSRAPTAPPALRYLLYPDQRAQNILRSPVLCQPP